MIYIRVSSRHVMGETLSRVYGGHGHQLFELRLSYGKPPFFSRISSSNFEAGIPCRDGRRRLHAGTAQRRVISTHRLDSHFGRRVRCIARQPVGASTNLIPNCNRQCVAVSLNLDRHSALCHGTVTQYAACLAYDFKFWKDSAIITFG